MLLLPERLTLKPVSRPRPYGDRRFWDVFYQEADVLGSSGNKCEQAEVEDRGRLCGD